MSANKYHRYYQHVPNRSRRWQPEMNAQAERMLRAGLTTARIAQRLGVSYNMVAAHMRGLIDHLRAEQQIRTLNEVAALFGVTNHTATGWLRRGWLEVSGRTNRPRATHYIDAVAIERFLSIRAAWPGWEPQRITDHALRERAAFIRMLARGRWISTRDAADRLGYAPKYMAEIISAGRLPATRYGHAYYIWSADLDAFAEAMR